jgi:hypothetical protein
MCICRLSVMVQLPNASSSDCYEITRTKIVTEKLRSYGVADRELMPETVHSTQHSALSTQRYENNRAERSHEATRVRERGMRKFKSVRQAQSALGADAAAYNLFNLARHVGTNTVTVTADISNPINAEITKGDILVLWFYLGDFSSLSGVPTFAEPQP